MDSSLDLIKPYTVTALVSFCLARVIIIPERGKKSGTIFFDFSQTFLFYHLLINHEDKLNKKNEIKIN